MSHMQGDNWLGSDQELFWAIQSLKCLSHRKSRCCEDRKGLTLECRGKSGLEVNTGSCHCKDGIQSPKCVY